MVKDLKVTYAPVFNQPINAKSHQRSMSQKFEREDFKAAEAQRAAGAAGAGAGAAGAENGRQNHLTPAEGRRVRRSSSNH